MDHWYQALNGLSVEPESDYARHLAHLVHLVKIMQKEQLAVGPFRNLPNYNVKPANLWKLKNYSEITEQRLRDMIEMERKYRFKIAVDAIQAKEKRPQENWATCYVV